MKDTPDLNKDDEPVFRLSPDGRSRIVGVYRSIDFELENIPVSNDGRYFLLKALDQKSFFIYDALTDSPLFSMPSYADLDPFASVKFRDQGIIVQITGTTADVTSESFYHAYSFDAAQATTWDAGGAQYSNCVDILADGSLICWTGEDPEHTNLVRYDPVTNTVTILQKNLNPVTQ